MDGSVSILIFQIFIIAVLLLFVLYMIKFNLSLRLTHRISKYSIEPLYNDQISLFDGLSILYHKVLDGLSKFLLKFKIIENYSHRYNKYIDYMDKKKPMDFVSNKILVALLFVFCNLFYIILDPNSPFIWGILIAAVAGFYVPDLYNMYQTYFRRKRIERDLLNAIIMLNNAFKSGRSTMQAIEIVKNELDGPIKEEFNKMYTEISYGLSLETVFERFANRVDVEEIRFITSSLTILNKTGGNIVKVFSSIERTMFSKRKLESELHALTSSSKSMSKVLLILPFAFAGIVLILSPTYFNSLFDNFIGLFVFFIMILLYVLYAFFVQKIMRVRL